MINGKIDSPTGEAVPTSAGLTGEGVKSPMIHGATVLFPQICSLFGFVCVGKRDQIKLDAISNNATTPSGENADDATPAGRRQGQQATPLSK